MVEQWSEEPCVASSILALGTERKVATIRASIPGSSWTMGRARHSSRIRAPKQRNGLEKPAALFARIGRRCPVSPPRCGESRRKAPRLERGVSGSPGSGREVSPREAGARAQGRRRRRKSRAHQGREGDQPDHRRCSASATRGLEQLLAARARQEGCARVRPPSALEAREKRCR